MGFRPMSQLPSTQWTAVLTAANHQSADGRQALASLCDAYWYPLYAYVRRLGYNNGAAEDLTQGFFARLIETDMLRNVGPEKGRFRSFLIVCLKRYIANEWHKENAAKRGGGSHVVSLDAERASRRYAHEPVDRLTPESLFERRWALTLLERTLHLLADEMRDAGHADRFDTLKVYLVADEQAPPYAHAARQLGLTEPAVKTAVYRLRQRYQQTLRREISRTLGPDDDVEQEIAHLFDAIQL